MGPGGPGGPRFGVNEQNKEPKPQSIKEVPGYVWRVISKFFYRLFYIFKLVWETNPLILIALLLFALLTGVIPVISSIVSANVLNTLARDYTIAQTIGGNFDDLMNDVMKLLIWQFVIIFGTSLINHVRTTVTRIAGDLVSNHVTVKIMKKAKEVDLASFDRPDFYERFENASREANSRPLQILSSTFSIVSTVISVVSYVIVLWSVSAWAPWVIIAMSIPSAIISFSYRRKYWFYMRHRSKDRRQLSYYSGLLTNKDMVKEIRMFDLSDTLIDRHQSIFKKYFKGLRRLFLAEGAWNMGIAVVHSLVNCLLFIFIATGVVRGDTQVGNYSLYTGALSSISNGVSSFIATTASIYEGTLFIDNLILFMNEKRNIRPISDEPVHVKRHIPHEIELRNVSFRYPGSDHDVIKNISCTIKAGETIVLVGLNGAGKTTLIKLITRLYDPTEGEIFLDGINIKEYDTQELYSIFGITFQDFGKYAVTVRENIAFSNIKQEIDEEKIQKAAREGYAEEFINKLPYKYDTPLMKYFEENGIEPSIGQWQKLSVARAFYSDSDILILDEPTASLDAIAEQEIYDQFDELRKGKTTIFVSHRLSSATTADNIIVIDEGRLIEYGPHAELMKNHGKYYELFSTQARRYITNKDSEGINEGNTRQ
ncbi:MAG: ABC transporter ATP-binding protein/permease [Clostridiales bacterium]|nr:ABC transporter ATP-binding protein/permease [Clostridiales bacterium]